MTFKIVTLTERPELFGRINELEDEAFPEYINEEPIWLRNCSDIINKFSDFHIFILDEVTDELYGALVSVPMFWSGDVQDLPGYNELLQQCLKQNEAGIKPNALIGILGAVSTKHQGKGISKPLFNAAKDIAKQAGMEHYLSPIRPNLKQLYPTFSTDTYWSWKNDKGRTFDPWLRSNENEGAEFLCFARNSITITDTIAQWEKWTNMVFPESNSYVIPGGHSLLDVDLESDKAFYGEDHYWYRFPFN